MIVQRLKFAAHRPHYTSDIERLFSQLSSKEFTFESKTIEEILNDDSIHHYVAINDDDKIVGYACFISMNLFQGKRYLIESVIVDTSYRKLGIGKKLMLKMLADLRSISAPHVNLTCNPNRSEAVRLYENLGFQKPNTSVFRYYF